MCQYCGGIIHHDIRCPMYDDSQDETGYICADCGEPIRKYERYVRVDEKAYHEDCLDDMDIEALVFLLGHKMEGGE